MKTRLFAIAVFSLALSLNVFGQDGTALDQSAREEVVRFMDLLQVRSRTVMVLDNMRIQQKRMAEQALQQEKPNATPQDIRGTEEVMDAAFNSVFSDQMIDEMIDAMVPIYQRHFSKADLDGILAFYTSPVGQKLQSETPAVTQETMQTMTDIMSNKLPEIKRVMKARLDKVAEQNKKANTSDGKD